MSMKLKILILKNANNKYSNLKNKSIKKRKLKEKKVIKFRYLLVKKKLLI